MRRTAVALIAALAALAAPTARAAEPPPEPLQYTSLTPASGERAVVQQQGGLPWTMTAKPGLWSVYVALKESPALGADGQTLSDVGFGRFDFFGLHESHTNPGTYQGVSNGGPNPNWWTAVPGTYYWQVQARWTDYSGPVPQNHYYVTAIFTVQIVPPEEERRPACASGYRQAQIGGKLKCLRSGQLCSWRYRHQYMRYHYACVRKGSRYRLVRR